MMPTWVVPEENNILVHVVAERIDRRNGDEKGLAEVLVRIRDGVA